MKLKQIGRRVVIVIGSGSVLAALLFIFGAMINERWIKAEEARWFAGAIGAAYRSFGPGFILMVLGFIGLLIMHERVWLLLLSEKNKEIHRISEQRNRLEEIVLKNRGTSNPGGKGAKPQRK